MTSLVAGSSSVTAERTGNGSGAGSGVGGAQGPGAIAPIAPIIEPPASFGIVAPGIYRCSASSLAQGLPNLPRNHHNKAAKTTVGSSSSSASGSANGSQATLATPPNPSTPSESFLSSLQLKTIVLLAPEKKPRPLAMWCLSNHVQLIHLGLGALADKDERSMENSESNNSSVDRLHPSLSLEKSLESYGGFPDSGILSLERIVKDSLEILLYRSKLPCLVCDTSGVNEAGVVVGCLRRMQRRSFASIRYEVSNIFYLVAVSHLILYSLC